MLRDSLGIWEAGELRGPCLFYDTLGMWVKWKVGTFSEGGEKFKHFSLYKIREGDTGSYLYFKGTLGFFHRADFD